MPYMGKCKWCGKKFEKPAILSIKNAMKSAIQGDRKDYCSDKCYYEAKSK
jgi:CO dehydrogenase/acetyl-CoA synthase alpha subunit